MIDYEYILTDAEYWEQERNHLVVKHNSLIQKTRYSLTTQQQKVLLYTISKIQPGDDDFKEYVFELKDSGDFISYSIPSNLMSAVCRLPSSRNSI